MFGVLVDLLGWVGTFTYLAAYYLVSVRWLAPDSFPYQGMNLLGGLLLSLNSAYHHAWPSLGLNLAWMLIGMVIVGKKLRRL